MSEALSTFLTDPLLLSITLPDGASGLFPRALVYDAADSLVATRDLVEVGGTGRYTDVGFTPAAVGTFTALFVVYTDAGHTIESDFYEHDQDSFAVSHRSIAAETTAAAGSTATEIRTALAQADDFFNNMQVVIVNAAGIVARNIDDFANTNGAITVTTLPFTPGIGDVVLILRRTGSVPVDAAAISTAVWSEALPGVFGAGEAGERVATMDDRVDVVVSTRSNFNEATDPVELRDSGGAAGTSAAELVDDVWDEAIVGHSGAGSAGLELQSKAEPGDAMDLVTNAVDADALGTDAVAEITAATDTVLSASHGAGSWLGVNYREVRQGWTRSITNPAGTRLRGVVHLENNGDRVVLPGTAELVLDMRDAAGVLLAGFTNPSVTLFPNSEGYFSHAFDPLTPAVGTIIVVRATITLSGVGSGTHVGWFEIAVGDF